MTQLLDGLRRRLHRDQGFTILESVVALVIIFGLILVLIRTFDTSTDVLVQANRRSAANALASELLERARSLEWEHMGLTANANGTDCPDDVACVSHPASISSEVTTNGNGNYAFDGEEIVFANGATFDPFLSFSDDVTRDDVAYTRYLFVTSVRDDPLDPATERLRRITAIVRWQAPSGFPEEIRLATLVADFVEPSQPFVTGEVAFDGGTVNLRGSATRCGSDPQCGAFVEGTSDLAGGTARDDLVFDVYFPDLLLSATTDYVSQGSYRGQGSTADIRWAGVDGLVTTADDVFTQVLPVGEDVYVDDDASSLPPLNEPRTFPVDLVPRFDSSEPAPRDLVVADLLVSADLDLAASPDLDEASVDGESWIRHDIDPGPDVDDGLPYTAAELDAAETTRVGFREYTDPAVRALYATWMDDLDEPSYEFTFARYGDHVAGDALAFDGDVDRFNDTSDNRQIHADFTWSAETLYLFDDELIGRAPGSSDFEGWVRVTMPELSASTPFLAGESASYPPSVAIGGDLHVEFWDAPNRRYETAFSGYSSLECAASSTTVSFGSLFGSAQSLTLALSGDHPNVTYEVDAQVTVQPFCPAHTLDANGDVAQSDVSFAQMVTGTVQYKVTDDLAALALGDGLLYDVALDFDGGGVDTTAIFVNPEA